MCKGDKRVKEYLIELDDVQEAKVKSIVDEKYLYHYMNIQYYFQNT